METVLSSGGLGTPDLASQKKFSNFRELTFERQLLELTGICVGVLASRGRKDEMAWTGAVSVFQMTLDFTWMFLPSRSSGPSQYRPHAGRPMRCRVYY